jgi:hypothetical protein
MAFSILFHLLVVAFLAQFIYARMEVRKERPLFISLRDKLDGPPRKGDGDDEKDEEPKPNPTPKPEEVVQKKPEEATRPPRQDEVAPPTAPVGPKSTAPAPQEEREGGEPAPAFSARSGKGKGDALKRFGGSHRSEAAVLHGLAWLARHQDGTGKWSTRNFNRHCPKGDLCSGTGLGYYDVGLTGLALLCFLGAGHTHLEGEYAEVVSRALTFICQIQYEDGCFGGKLGNHMYYHAICTLAMAELYGLTRSGRAKAAATKGLAYLAASQQDGGGWDYTQLRTNRNDTSVTGWAVMALKSAYAAGLPFPERTWARARRFLQKACRSDGRVRYADRGFIGFHGKVRYGIGMTAVGLLCLLYFNENPRAPRMKRMVEILIANPPEPWALKHDRLHTMYYWYYATLALFHVGGAKWQAWNAQMRDFIISRQVTSGCAKGSFDPEGGWLGPHAGRVYATVFNILNLEVYYRYLPLYSGSGPPTEVTQKAARKLEEVEAVQLVRDPSAKVGERLRAMGVLAKNPTDEGLDALWDALGDKNSVIRWKAAETLGKVGDPRSVPRIAEALGKDDGTLAATYIDALADIGHPSAVPHLIARLEDPSDRVREKVCGALWKITGQKLGNDPAAWRRWWEDRRDK